MLTILAHNNKEILLGQKFKLLLKRKLGGGSFGEIYLGLNTKTNEDVAIKMVKLISLLHTLKESSKSKYPQLCFEAQVLSYLQGGIGIPKLNCYFSTEYYNFMIIDLLGPSLEDLFTYCQRKFSLKTVLMLGDQMISRLEFIHGRHFVHRDIKPDNFLIGRGKKANQVYIIDFGLAKRFRDSKTGLHIPYKDGKSLTGTARYASIYTHLGVEQSRRDDLESLAYVLIYLYKGSLPWQGLKTKGKREKYEKIMEKKIAISAEELCDGMPDNLVTFLQYTRNLQFEEIPDYSFLKSLLRSSFINNNYEYDSIFDWNLIDEKSNETIEKKKEDRDEDENEDEDDMEIGNG